MDRAQERRLFALLLDGLDDLYDQRFGGAVDADRPARTEIWLVRLLTAVGVALQGSVWETRLLDAAAELRGFIVSGLRGDDLNDRALAATHNLRLALAAEL